MLNCPLVCRLRGPLDRGEVEHAAAVLASRHEALRTTFVGRGPRLVQLIHEPEPVSVSHRDCSSAPDPEAAARAELDGELRTDVDCTSRPSRVTLWRIGDEDHLLCLNMHHLVTDLWSCGVLADELEAILGGGEASLPEPPRQFREFAAWQARRLEHDELQGHREYWHRQLAGMRPAELPFAHEPSGDARGRAVLQAEIGAAIRERLEALARARQTTLFATLLAAFYALVHRHTGARDVSIASLFANRTRPEFRGTVGFLVNMVALRVRIAPGASCLDLLRETHRTVVEAFVHQEVPLHLTPGAAVRSRPRFDDVVFHMTAEPISRVRDAGDLQLEFLVPDLRGRFAFELALMPRPDAGLAVKLFYSREALEERAASDVVASFVAVAGAIADAATVALDRLPVPPSAVWVRD